MDFMAEKSENEFFSFFFYTREEKRVQPIVVTFFKKQEKAKRDPVIDGIFSTKTESSIWGCGVACVFL